VISLEGMIAASDGHFSGRCSRFRPTISSTWTRSTRPAAIANGRHSAEGGEKEKLRRRIVLTRRVNQPTVDPGQCQRHPVEPRLDTVRGGLAAAARR